jgi:ATP-dependent Clp protease ATP-binding subunit ClpA
VITFATLSNESMQRVVDKLIGELEEQLSEKKVRIELTDAARTWLARKGHDPDFGARPLRRLIMKEIGDVLSEQILFGNLSKGGKVLVDMNEDELSFSYSQ